MKITILRPDGTKIEAEGTAEEAAAVVKAISPQDPPIFWPAQTTTNCLKCGSWYQSGTAHVCLHWQPLLKF